MIIEVILGLIAIGAVAVLFWRAWRTMPAACALESVTVSPAPPASAPHDVLVDYARELNFTALTAEGAAEHHLALLEALLSEAEHESMRSEILIDKLGQHLVRGSAA